MLKKIILPSSIVFIGTAIISVLVFAKPKPTPQPAAEEPAHVAVAVTEAMPKTMRLAVTTQGTVKPKREIDLVAQVSGQVVAADMAFVSGGFFDEQQVLLQIDERDYRVAHLNAQARVADAQRRLAEEEGLARQAQREWRDLGNQNANELFTRKPQLEAARANLKFAQADLEMAQLNLSRTKMSAPFAGRIKTIYADLGQFVAAGSRVASVYDSTRFEVRLPLTERQAALIHLPLKPINSDVQAADITDLAKVTISGSVAGVKHEWPARLTRTDAYLDPDSRMYYAIAEITPSTTDQKSASLLPGLFVEAKIEGKEIDDVIELPRSALFQRDKILSVDDDQKIVHHTVEVLRKSEDAIWVKASISENTLIALEKQSITPHGTQVRPVLTENATENTAENTHKNTPSRDQSRYEASLTPAPKKD
jgi:RND family efflux transporter MFP subunit